MSLKISYNLNGVEEKYKALMIRSIVYLDEVVYSTLFLECLREEIAKSNNLEGETSEWKNKSAEQIYAALTPIKLKLFTYYTIKNVIGYGVASNKNIYVNTKYLSHYSVNELLDLMEVGSNLLHEHSHDCGFDHDFEYTARRDNSVSYVLNRAYAKCFKLLNRIPAQELPPVIYYTPWYKKLFRWFLP